MRWTLRQWCNVFVLISVLLAPGAALANSPDWQALFAGEVMIDTVQHLDDMSGLRALFTIAATREHIWTTLIDYDNFPKIFPDIQKVRVLEQDQHGAQVEFWIDAMLSTYHYVLQRRYAEPRRRLTWTRVAGDLKRIEGSWEIRDTPRSGIHMLVYESYVDVGGLAPAFIVRMEATRRIRQMSERLRSWIEGRPVSE